MSQTAAPETSTPEVLIPGTPAYEHEMARLNAVHVLAMNRVACPELVRAEATARLELAAAIIAMDEVEDRIAGGAKIHSLQQQVDVEMASHAYARALANLIRRESGK